MTTPCCVRAPPADITVRLLLSIGREQSRAEMLDTVQLALRLRDRGVVGVDLTGNPTAGEVRHRVPAVLWRREAWGAGEAGAQRRRGHVGAGCDRGPCPPAPARLGGLASGCG